MCVLNFENCKKKASLSIYTVSISKDHIHSTLFQENQFFNRFEGRLNRYKPLDGSYLITYCWGANLLY